MGQPLANATAVGPSEIKLERRRQILDAAKRVFARKGFHNASISDIILQAGIARGTFYLYFDGKSDVFGKLLDELLEELRQRIRPIELGAGHPAPLEQLKANIRRVLELVTQEPELIQVLLRHAVGSDQRSAEMVRGFYERVLSLVERSLEHGMRMGLIRPCQTQIVAACVLGTVKEVAEWLTVRRKEIPPLDPLVEEIVGFGLRGLLAETPKEKA